MTSVAIAYTRPSVISATATTCCVPARRMRDSISTRSTGTGNSNAAMSGTGFVSENRRTDLTNGPGANGPSTVTRMGTAKPLSAMAGIASLMRV